MRPGTWSAVRERRDATGFGPLQRLDKEEMDESPKAPVASDGTMAEIKNEAPC